jgi:large subunit ribosomal protein L21
LARAGCGEVKIGEKQYRAVEGTWIDVDRMQLEVGSEVTLDQVLLVSDGDNISVGAPVVSGVLVNAKVLDHIKGPKVIVFKYRPKKHYRNKNGHRQQYTHLLVETIKME